MTQELMKAAEVKGSKSLSPDIYPFKEIRNQGIYTSNISIQLQI